MANMVNRSKIPMRKKQEKDGPNIYELPVEIGDVLGGRQTRVKVLIQWPNGITDVRIPSGEDTDTINLLKNIALKRWRKLQVVFGNITVSSLKC